jgi:hypothetical protein
MLLQYLYWKNVQSNAVCQCNITFLEGETPAANMYFTYFSAPVWFNFCRIIRCF